MKRVKRVSRWSGLVVILIVVLAGCKSSKNASGASDAGTALKGERLLEAVIANTPVYESFSSRIKMTLPTGKSEITLNGYLKMQRDELIQISLLIPILRTEAVRIEISPDRILMIDRINKRYADTEIEELQRVFGPYLDFNALQALFSNSFFLYGKTEFKKRDFSSFKALPLDTECVILTRQDHDLKYSFTTSQKNNRLISSEVTILNNGYSMDWRYDHFVEVEQTTFPSDVQIEVRNPQRSSKVGIEISRISIDKQTLTTSPVPAKYQPVSLSELIEKVRG